MIIEKKTKKIKKVLAGSLACSLALGPALGVVVGRKVFAKVDYSQLEGLAESAENNKNTNGSSSYPAGSLQEEVKKEIEESTKSNENTNVSTSQMMKGWQEEMKKTIEEISREYANKDFGNGNENNDDSSFYGSSSSSSSSSSSGSSVFHPVTEGNSNVNSYYTDSNVTPSPNNNYNPWDNYTNYPQGYGGGGGDSNKEDDAMKQMLPEIIKAILELLKEILGQGAKGGDQGCGGQ